MQNLINTIYFLSKYAVLLIFLLSVSAKVFDFENHRKEISKISQLRKVSTLLLTLLIIIELGVIYFIGVESEDFLGGCVALGILLLYTTHILTTSASAEPCNCLGLSTIGRELSKKGEVIRNSVMMLIVIALVGANIFVSPRIDLTSKQLEITLLASTTLIALLLLFLDLKKTVEKELLGIKQNITSHKIGTSKIFYKVPNVVVVDTSLNRVSLHDVLPSDRRCFALFVAEGCGTCRRMLREPLLQSPSGKVDYFIFNLGTDKYVQELQADFPTFHVYRVLDMELPQALEADRLPTAICINEEKEVFSSVAVGEDLIKELLIHIGNGSSRPWIYKFNK